MLPVVGIGILLAVQVPQTGILLTLAFDVLGACLLVPFVLASTACGHAPAAFAAIVTGATVRIVCFVLPRPSTARRTPCCTCRTPCHGGVRRLPVFLATAASLAAFLLAGGPTTEPEPVGEPREPEVTAALPAAG